MKINQLTALQPIDRPGYASIGRCLECGCHSHFPHPHLPTCSYNEAPGQPFEVIVFNPETELNHDSN